MLSNTLGSSERFQLLVDDHPNLAEFAHALYQLMVPHADDFGRLPIDPTTVRIRYYGVSRRSREEFLQALDILCLDVSVDRPAPPPDQQKAIRHLLLRYRTEAGIIGQIVNFEAHQQGLHKRTRSAFPAPPGWDVDGDGCVRDIPGMSRTPQEGPGHSGEFHLKGSRREEEVEGKKKRTVPIGSVHASRADQAMALVECYHAICCTAVPGRPTLPRVSSLTPTRIAHACARLAERPLEPTPHQPPSWHEVFEHAMRSPFICGLVPPAPPRTKPFLGDFDWLVRSTDTAVHILEGKYDDRRSAPRPAAVADIRRATRDRHAAAPAPQVNLT